MYVCLFRVAQPILIGKLLAYFSREKSNTTELKQAYIYASGLLLTMLVNILLFHNTQLELTHCGMKMRVACCSVIFKKVTLTHQINDVYNLNKAFLIYME